MIKQNQQHLNRLFIFLDGVVITLSLFLAWIIRIYSGWMQVETIHLPFDEYMKPLIIIVPIYLLLYNFFNLYAPHRTHSVFDEFYNLLKANITGISVFLSILYINKNVHYSRYLLLIFAITCLLLNFTERCLVHYILRKFRKKGYNLKHIVIVGYSQLTVEFIKLVHRNKHWGYDVVGIIDDHQKLNYTYDGIKVIGRMEDLQKLLTEKYLDEVIITLSLEDYSKLGYVIKLSEKMGVYTRIIPDYYRYIPTRPYVEEIDGLPIISTRQIPLNDLVKRTIKRSIDIFGSLFGLLILSPLMILITILIKLTSKGPILYKQTRIGLNRQSFKMLKFRSMKVQETDKETKAWTIKNDPRVTPLGKFLRKTSLDELPQLFNVLKGDMSLIGPRPERPYFVEKFKEEIPKYMIKHQVRPGITGWAQVHGWRGDTSIRKRIEYDLYYIENWSLFLDIKIFIMTFFNGFVNKNAY